jgi:protein phosphatase PTC7
VEKGGEDALSAHKQLLIIADGVGEWNNRGIDPGLYSKELVKNVSKTFAKKEEFYTENLKKLIINSHRICK